VAEVAVVLKQGPCPGDGYRHHGSACLDRDAERALLELAGAALFALVAGALGEDDKAPAALHDGGGVVQGPDGGAHVVPLDEHAAQQLHPAVEQGDLPQLLLGQDAVGPVQPGQQQGDIIVAAVVAHKHTGSVFGDVVQPLHQQLDPCDVQDLPAPVGDVLVDDLLHRVHVACGQRALAPAEDIVVDDHVSKKIEEHCNGAENAHERCSFQWEWAIKIPVYCNTLFRKKGEKILFLQILAFAACKIHKIRV
jgi:hypothetical protein